MIVLKWEGVSLSVFSKDTFNSKQKEFLHDTRDLEKKIALLKEKIAKIDMDFANGDISTSQYTRITSQLSEDHSVLENELHCHNDEKVPYSKCKSSA